MLQLAASFNATTRLIINSEKYKIIFRTVCGDAVSGQLTIAKGAGLKSPALGGVRICMSLQILGESTGIVEVQRPPGRPESAVLIRAT